MKDGADTTVDGKERRQMVDTLFIFFLQLTVPDIMTFDLT